MNQPTAPSSRMPMIVKRGVRPISDSRRSRSAASITVLMPEIRVASSFEYILPSQAALRASRIWPSRCTMAASTGVGLFQCVHSQAAQRKRSFAPPSSSRASHCSGVAHIGQ